MKKIIILFLMLNSLFCFSEGKKNTKQMIDEDCEYLKKYITNAYANYDLDVEKGYDIDKAIKDIKKLYKKNYGYKGSFQLLSKETEEAKNSLLPESKKNKNLENYQKHIIGSPTDRLNYLPQYGNEKLRGNLYILIDRGTVSAAEFGIAFAYLVNKNKVILVGEKTLGAATSDVCLKYTLPNSKIEISLGDYSYYNATFFSQNKRWNGDTKGFYPDYWCTQDTILPTLIELTKDEELAAELVGLEKGMVY